MQQRENVQVDCKAKTDRGPRHSTAPRCGDSVVCFFFPDLCNCSMACGSICKHIRIHTYMRMCAQIDVGLRGVAVYHTSRYTHVVALEAHHLETGCEIMPRKQLHTDTHKYIHRSTAAELLQHPLIARSVPQQHIAELIQRYKRK